MNEAFSWEAFNKMPLVAILRNMPTDSLEAIANCMVKAGISTMEITYNTPGALDSIREMTKKFSGQLNIGAGTICTLTEMHQALHAGAQFIVMPIADDNVVNYCMRHKIPVFPGAYTPTEIFRAWQMGASMVKVFPANNLGPSYIKDVLAPLNEIKLMPTGGVTLENLGDFFRAGASGVGLGGGLVPKDLVLSKDWKGLTKRMTDFVRMYNKVTL